MLCHSSKVIGMDAFISDKSFDVFKNMDLKLNYYNYTKPLIKRTYQHVESKTVSIPSKIEGKDKSKTLFFEPFMDKMEELIFSGKKMFIFISAREKLEIFKQRLLIRGMDSNKIACYTAREKDDLIDVNKTWVNKDVVLCTTSITVGVNFDIPDHFHSIGIYMSATSKNLVRDVFQSSYRVRHLIDNKLYFSLDANHYGINEPVFKHIIKEELLTKEENILTLFKKYKEEATFSKATEEWKADEQNQIMNERYFWLENLYVNNIFEYNLSIMELKLEFYKYLICCNYELDITSDEEEKVFLEDIIDTPKVIISYNDIPPITPDEMKRIRRLEIKTDLDIAKLEKFFFQQTIVKVEPEEEHAYWAIYIKHGKSKFRNISYEKGLRDNTINLSDIVSTTLPILAEKLSLQLEVIQNLTSWYGVKNSHDIEPKIEDKKLKLLIPIFEENMRAIHDAFDLRDRRDTEKNISTDNIIKITNKVLSKWGFSKVKRTKRIDKVVNGKRTQTSEFKIELEEEVYDKIKPKNYKKENKPLLSAKTKQ